LEAGALTKMLNDPLVFNVSQHLAGFTGLRESELQRRLARQGVYHFEVGHAFADPKSTTELAWFYSTSVDYLFGNAIHPALDFGLTPADGPVLDYSGGVGNNVILLASSGIKCVYFGIGLLEFAFAQYRVRRLGLQNMVHFLKPYDSATGWDFDARKVLRNSSFGTILAIDVLEHIPQWQLTVEALVHSLRPGGRFIEDTPFAADLSTPPAPLPPVTSDVSSIASVVGDEGAEVDVDLRVHVGRGRMSMAQAMGPSMVLLNWSGGGTTNFWRKH